MHKKQRKTGIVLVVLAVLFVTVLTASIILKKYTVKTVYVEGNLHYTQEEIKDYVLRGPFGDNSLFLSLKHRLMKEANIPFVDVVDVTILAPDTIQITVYEKALAGYIQYMDSYMYFDKDGYVVECAGIVTEGIPQVLGLSFDHMVLGELLPVEEPEVFGSIMELTKMLDKYGLPSDKIYFHSTGDVTLYFGEIKAALGSDRNYLEAKMMRLPELLAKVEGKKGTLHMENLTLEKTDVSFREE